MNTRQLLESFGSRKADEIAVAGAEEVNFLDILAGIADFRNIVLQRVNAILNRVGLLQYFLRKMISFIPVAHSFFPPLMSL
ncbi:hypothetical protein D3C77_485780 [compost metagenome]